MNVHQDQYLINGIIEGNSAILERIYKDYSLTITSFILNNKGTIEDAKDIFQEGIIGIYTISQKKEIKLTCSFITYLNVICRRLWWKKQRRDKYELVDIEEVEFKLTDNTSINRLETIEKYELYQEKLNELKPKKRQMLELYFDGKRMAEIAEIMGLKSVGYARKFKYQCKQSIEELIKKDSRYSDFVINF